MSLMRTLAKVAIGVAVAKGAKAVMQNNKSGAGGGGLGGLLGAGGMMSGLDRKVEAAPDRPEADFGAVLNSQFDSTGAKPVTPSKDQEALAGLMISAMIQAAKSDGTFDDKEREKLLSKLSGADPDEEAFVTAQMEAPVDVDNLVAQTPDGMGPKVYAMALLAIELDTQQEAQFLHKLANGYGMTPDEVNDIHAQVGVPSLYA